jgi:hypothetical protein
MFFETISEAEGCMVQRGPSDANQIILVSDSRAPFMPLNEADRIVDKKTEQFTKTLHKAFNARRTDDRQRAGVGHLGPHHQEAGKTEAVIAVKVADGQDPERLDPQLCLLQVDLAAFSGVEKVELPLEPYHH